MSFQSLMDDLEQQAIIEANQLSIKQYDTLLKFTFPNPLNYVCIRKMFGEEQNKDILIVFINDVLNRKGTKKIVKVEFLDLSYYDDAIGDAKYKLHPIDAICTDAEGGQFIIQIGSFRFRYFGRSTLEESIQIYAKKVYYPYIKTGEKYENIQSIQFIAILEKPVIDCEEKRVLEDKLVNEPMEIDAENKFFVTYFQPKAWRFKSTNLAQWGLYFDKISMNRHWVFDHRIKRESILDKAFRTLEIQNWTTKQLRTYLIAEARYFECNGHDEVISQNSYYQGRFTGKKLAQEHIVSRLAEYNLDAEQISQITELPIDRVQQLQSYSDHKQV